MTPETQISISMRRCTGCGTYEHEIPQMKEQNPQMLACCPDADFKDVTPMRSLKKYLEEMMPKFKEMSKVALTEDQLENVLQGLIDDLEICYIKAEDQQFMEAVKLGHSCGHIINAEALSKKYLETRYNVDLWKK